MASLFPIGNNRRMNINAKLNLVLAMQVFARVVEAGTFTRAADSLKMPKATVTKLVQGLENHLRVKLLNRTTRRVTVTPDGSAYYERAVRLLGDLEDIESSVSNAQASPKGRLRIDVGGSLASLFLIPRLPAFLERYPEIQVEVGVSDRPVDLVSENVDCVIRGGPLTEQSLVARHVGDLPWVTCATPAYLARHGTPTHPSDLESRACDRESSLGAHRSPLPARLRTRRQALRDRRPPSRGRQRKQRAPCRGARRASASRRCPRSCCRASRRES